MGIPIVYHDCIRSVDFAEALIVFVAKYQTAKPDEALIISGSYLGSKNVHKDESNNKIKIVRGGGVFVLPVFQRSESNQFNIQQIDVYQNGDRTRCTGDV